MAQTAMEQTAMETRKMEWENEITNHVANMVAILLQNHIPSCNIDAYPSLLKDEFGNKGYQRSLQFSWKLTTDKTIEFYNSLL